MPHFYSLVLVSAVLSCGSISGQEIVAHRGASFDAPENTLAAFRLAWKMNADAIEADFYLSSDKQIVCIHDKTTKRLVPNSPEVSVAKSTLKELRSLDVGSWKAPRFADERIPTLEEVLKTIPDGKRILVEIKCGREIIAPLKKQLAASSLQPEQIVIICFQANVIAECRRVMPQYKANWLTSYKRKADTSDWEPTQQRVLKTLKETNATGLGSNGKREVINQAFVDAVRTGGHEVHVWTINDADTAREFQKLNVDSITTDRPGYIRNILKRKIPVRVQ